MKKVGPAFGYLAVFACGVLLVSPAAAGLRQRLFVSAPDEKGNYGQESIIHWPKGSTIDITYHDFTGIDGGEVGSSGSTNTSIDPTEFGAMVQTAIDRWLDPWSGLGLALTADLSATLSPTSDDCEYIPNGDLGGHNILLTRKMDTTCGDQIGMGTGIVGLTGVRYFLSNGEIAEADIQFNDRDYQFVTTGESDLSTTPRQINLPDVLTHEFGHFFGLDHSASRVSTMLFSVADGQDTPSTLDRSALYSLYPPEDSDDVMGSVQGSILRGSNPVFGAFLSFLDARTLETVATEISDLNGAFEACRVPTGPHLVFARAYKPAQQLSHFYYSGYGSDLSSTEDTNGDCLNPGCKILDQSLGLSFFGTAASVGYQPHIFNVEAGTPAGYINIAAKNSMSAPEDASNDLGTPSEMELDVPVLEWLGTEFGPDDPGTTLIDEAASDDSGDLFEASDEDYFRVQVPASGDLAIRTAALSIYSRVSLVVDVMDAAGDPLAECTPRTSAYQPQVVAMSTVGAEENPAFDANVDSLDPGWDCSGLPVPSVVILHVRGDYLLCGDIAGSSAACNGATLEDPVYLISAFDPQDAGDRTPVAASSGLSSSSKALSTYTGLPACSKYSATVGGGKKAETEETACCGTLRSGGPGGPDAFLSFLLALLLSPLTWFAAWWVIKKPAFAGSKLLP